MILQEYGLLVLLDTFQGIEVHEHCSKVNRLGGSQQIGRDRVSLFMHSLQTKANFAFFMTWGLMSFYNGES